MSTRTSLLLAKDYVRRYWFAVLLLIVAATLDYAVSEFTMIGVFGVAGTAGLVGAFRSHSMSTWRVMPTTHLQRWHAVWACTVMLPTALYLLVQILVGTGGYVVLGHSLELSLVLRTAPLACSCAALTAWLHVWVFRWTVPGTAMFELQRRSIAFQLLMFPMQLLAIMGPFFFAGYGLSMYPNEIRSLDVYILLAALALVPLAYVYTFRCLDSPPFRQRLKASDLLGAAETDGGVDAVSTGERGLRGTGVAAIIPGMFAVSVVVAATGVIVVTLFVVLTIGFLDAHILSDMAEFAGLNRQRLFLLLAPTPVMSLYMWRYAGRAIRTLPLSRSALVLGLGMLSAMQCLVPIVVAAVLAAVTSLTLTVSGAMSLGVFAFAVTLFIVFLDVRFPRAAKFMFYVWWVPFVVPGGGLLLTPPGAVFSLVAAGVYGMLIHHALAHQTDFYRRRPPEIFS